MKICEYYKISADYLFGLTNIKHSPMTREEIKNGMTIDSEQHAALEKILDMLVYKEK